MVDCAGELIAPFGIQLVRIEELALDLIHLIQMPFATFIHFAAQAVFEALKTVIGAKTVNGIACCLKSFAEAILGFQSPDLRDTRLINLFSILIVEQPKQVGSQGM